MKHKTALWRAITVVIALYAVVLQALAQSAVPVPGVPADQGIICHGASASEDAAPSGPQKPLLPHGLCCSLACAGLNLSGPVPTASAAIVPPVRLFRAVAFAAHEERAATAPQKQAFEARGPPSVA